MWQKPGDFLYPFPSIVANPGTQYVRPIFQLIATVPDVDPETCGCVDAASWPVPSFGHDLDVRSLPPVVVRS